MEKFSYPKVTSTSASGAFQLVGEDKQAYEAAKERERAVFFLFAGLDNLDVGFLWKNNWKISVFAKFAHAISVLPFKSKGRWGFFLSRDACEWWLAGSDKLVEGLTKPHCSDVHLYLLCQSQSIVSSLEMNRDLTSF